MDSLEINCLSTIDEVNKNAWNEVVTSSSLGCIYHRYDWIKSIEQSKSYQPLHVTVYKNGSLTGIFPNFVKPIPKTPLKRLVSIGVGHGGPIFKSDKELSFDRVFKRIQKVSGKLVIGHSISTLSRDYVMMDSKLEDFSYQPKLSICRFVLDIDRSWESILNSMKKSRRREVVEARSRNYEIRHEPLDEESLRLFYQDYEQMMGRVGGDAHPFSFFLNISKNMPENIKIVAVKVEDEVAGRHMYLMDHEEGVIHHHFSAVTSDNFEYKPSELIHAHMIDNSDDKFTRYDFGGTAPDFTDGLFKYKKAYGGETVPVLSWRKSFSTLLTGLFKIGKKGYKLRQNM